MKKQTWRQWARLVEKNPNSPSRLRKGSLAPLTGQDGRVLDAFVACLELYACSDDFGRGSALSAARALLPAMQPSTRWIARELIPFVLDWDDRNKLWGTIAAGIVNDYYVVRDQLVGAGGSGGVPSMDGGTGSNGR